MKKTGLGSSAAVVSALVGAILSFHEQSDITHVPPDFLDRVHNLAQVSHIAAQGKIGSGFDVAAAVYGSCLYRTYEKDVLASLSDLQPVSPQLIQTLVEGNVEGKKLTCEIEGLGSGIPPGLRLVVCDVEGGSQTVGMVRNVNSWRKAKSKEADSLWTRLNEQNETLMHLMRTAASRSGEGGDDNSNEDSQIMRIIPEIRASLRAMGEAASVPIEPPSQTRILDICSELDGVLGGVVPGAGGYDALVFLVRDRPAVLDALRNTLVRLSSDVREATRVSILDVRESHQGLKLEQPESEMYTDWLSLA